MKTGDTLWDISKVFLRDPWYWPEIWYVNPQVENPHLIYPGDVLKLVYIDGQPRVTLGDRGGAVESGGGKRLSPQVRREPLSQAITAIPYDVIASFMGRPTLLDKDQVQERAVRRRDARRARDRRGRQRDLCTRHRQRGGGRALQHHSRRREAASIRRPTICSATSGMYVGSGPVATTGDPAKLLLTDSTREALQGDKLFPESVDVNVDFVPHAPTSDVDARVIAVRDHTVMGQYTGRRSESRLSAPASRRDTCSRSARRGGVVRDRYSKGGLSATSTSIVGRRRQSVQLPDERVGIVMVFKAFDRMSYALVMETTHEIRQGDLATNP